MTQLFDGIRLRWMAIGSNHKIKSNRQQSIVHDGNRRKDNQMKPHITIAACIAVFTNMAIAGDSAPFLLDTAEGTHIAREVEQIAYSPHWNGADECSIALDGTRLLSTAESGSLAWPRPATPGGYTLTHTAGGETLMAQFAVLGDDTIAIDGTRLQSNSTWTTSKTWLITGALTVPSGVSLTIERGAVVKFMPGTSLMVESGGSCTARGVIFTHVNDDTIGGDVLCDGDSSMAVMGDYTITGTITDDDSTEYRYMPPQTLMSSISSNTRLRGYRTYIASNSVTVASGATLTLQPGTILKFNTGCSLTVNGTLDAQGTRAAPIVFTSLKDDAHGGDTNGDGENSLPDMGDWKNIAIIGNVNFSHVKCLYGGGVSNSSDTGMLAVRSGGKLSLDCCVLEHGLFDGVFSYGTVTGENTIIYDCDRGVNTSGGTGVFRNCVVDYCRWGVMAEGGSGTYYNCVITRFFGSNAWPTGWGVAYWSGSLKTYNCCVWSTLSGASNYRSSPTAVRNMSVDPRFLDPDNGDFRIAENSPCINAGDAANAPEFDYYGQPRDEVPDIGIYEVMGANTTGYDLAAVAVNAQAARSTIGDTIEVSYDVANVGRLAVTDPWHDALYLVSSTSGKQYALGEPLNPGGIGAGETCTFTLRFALPVVPVGQYRLRLVVNSRRMDVPEGTATENNVLVSEEEIEVVADSADASDGASGNVAVGASAVCAFTLPSGSGDRLMRVTSSAGGATLSARCGLGFLPVNADAGTALSFSGGAAWISVPAGTEKVWLVLDNGGPAAAPYEVEFIDGSLTLLGISPASIPSSGNVTVEIAGAGFTDACEVSFTGAGTVAPLSVKRVSQGLLAATLDAAAFASGKTYSVTVKKGTETKTLQDALSVAAAPGKPKFWAKLDVPSSMRQGRLVETCFIEYGNSGTADMLSPVLQVSMTGDGTLGYIGGLSGQKTLQFVAAGDAGSAGVLRPGSSHRIRFAIRAGASNKISLHTSEGSNYAPAPWTNAADYLADLSSAATRIDLRGQDATDYVRVFDLAKAVKNGEPTSAIYGRVVDENGEGVEGLSISFANVNTNETVFTVTGVSGEFCTENINADTFSATFGEGLDSSIVGVISVNADRDVALGSVRVKAAYNFHVRVSGINDKTTALSATDILSGNSRSAFWLSDSEAVFRGLPDGMYVVECYSEDSARLAESVTVIGGKAEDVAFLFGGSCSLNVTANGLADAEDCFVALFRNGAIERSVNFNAEGRISLSGIAPGEYHLFAGRDGSEDVIGEFVAIENGGSANVTWDATGRLAPTKSKAYILKDRAVNNVTKGMSGVFGDYQKEKDAENLIKAAEELINAAVLAIQPPQGAYDCVHNRETYKNDLRRLEEYRRAYIEFALGAWLRYKGAKAYKWGQIFRLGPLTGELLAKAYFGPVAGAFTSIFNNFVSYFMGAKDPVADMGEQVSAFGGAILEVAKKEATENPASGIDLGVWGNMASVVGKIKSGISALFLANDIKSGFVKQSEAEETLAKAYTKFWFKMCDLEWYLSINSFGKYHLCPEYDSPILGDPVDNKTPSVPKSWDPNEMVGEKGIGEARYVRPGQELTYTIYFENKTGFDIADAQEVKVTNPLSEWLDWSTFEMREVAFNNQCDVNLDGLANGTSEVQMNGTNKYVRTTVECDTGNGVVTWYMRVYDPHGDSEGYPLDGSGFLPSNDDTHRGEGHITYRIKVRDDAPACERINASATIVFDYNDPIVTDPAWWNTVSPIEGYLQAGEYFKATLAELGYDVPTDGTAYNVVAKGLPAGLQLKSNAAVKDKKGRVVKAAKSEWWIEGVPTAKLDFFENPPYLVITVNGVAVTAPLPIQVVEQEVTELPDLVLDQSLNEQYYLQGVGAGWTVSGLPTGLKYATKKVTKTTGSGKKKVTTTVAEAYAVYGKTTKAGLFTITAKKRVGAFYETLKYRVLVKPAAVDESLFGTDLVDIESMAYDPVEWDLVAGGHVGRLALPAVSAVGGVKVAKVTGLPTGLSFAASDTYGYKNAKKKTGKYLKQKGQTILGTPTKAGTYVVTFTKNVKEKVKGKMKTVAKTAQILWVVTQNDAELSLGFNTVGGVIESGVVGLKYTDLMSFAATSNATVTASGLPVGIKLVKLDDGHAGRVPLPGFATWGFQGFTAKAGTYLVTVKAALNGNTVTQRVALKVDGLPAWAKGTFNGYIAGADGATNGLATVTVSAAGKVSGKFYDRGTNWTFTAASYTGYDDAASAYTVPIEAKFAYKVTEKVKGKKKTVTKYVTRSFTLAVVDNGELGGTATLVEADVGSTVHARQNLWGSTYKALGKTLFSSKSGKKTLAYKTFAIKSTDPAGEAMGLLPTETLSLKVTTAGAVTATMSFDTGKRSKGKAVVYKATCSTVVIPLTTPDAKAAEFKGIVYLYFAPSTKNSFTGFAGAAPF